MTHFFRVLGSLAGSRLLSRAAPAAPQPNIVLFLSDDMGWDQVGFNGGKVIAMLIETRARGGNLLLNILGNIIISEEEKFYGEISGSSFKHTYPV